MRRPLPEYLRSLTSMVERRQAAGARFVYRVVGKGRWAVIVVRERHPVEGEETPDA